MDSSPISFLTETPAASTTSVMTLGLAVLKDPAAIGLITTLESSAQLASVPPVTLIMGQVP